MHTLTLVLFSQILVAQLYVQGVPRVSSHYYTHMYVKSSLRGRGCYNSPPLLRILSSKYIYLYPQTKYGYSYSHFHLFSRCFLNIVISPNNLNHRKSMFSKLFNFIIHDIYWFVNHQIFYTFHL